jgi:hypothetical protein
MGMAGGRLKLIIIRKNNKHQVETAAKIDRERKQQRFVACLLLSASAAAAADFIFPIPHFRWPANA